ncbi:MAG: DUF5678 domain-containing protein [bacterium]
MVPQEQRKHQDFIWLGKHMPSLQQKYAGKVVAIVKKDVSVGKDAVEAYNRSQKKHPGQEPLLSVIPSEECLLL